MNINDAEWVIENQRLAMVLKEIQKQLDEKRDFNERIKKEAIETQRELWQEVGSISIANELDQLVDFMSFIDVLKRQKRSHEFTKRLTEKYERMALAPYFGRIDFKESGESRAESYYIGISNLANDAYDILIYDWRAPVSSMFYDYEAGKASYSCPEGDIYGEITLKRQYKISKDKIEYMFDSNLVIDDEMLQEILGKSTDGRMKAIVTTIQREQNRAIRNEEFKNLIVQGPAGSGKTSVALHRVAYLLYKYRDKITAQNIVIFSPNEIFNDYISNVLPQLDEENMYQTTFKAYMHKALEVELKKEDYYTMMEYILASRDTLSYKKRIMNIIYKSSKAFIDVLKRYVSYVEGLDRGFGDLLFNGSLVISSTELHQLFYKDYSELPLKKRLQKIRERVLFLLKPYEKQRINEIADELLKSGGYIDRAEIRNKSRAIIKDEIKDLHKEIKRMTEFDLVDIYIKLFEGLENFAVGHDGNTEELNEIKAYTLENLKAKALNYEDQPPLLFLKGAFGDLPKTKEIKYVVIDEAQDYTPLQYEIFHQLFQHASITMLGDINQSINPFMNVGDYSNVLDIFTQENTCIMNLSKSYRSTIDIIEFSRRLLNKGIDAESVARHGEKPMLMGFEHQAAIKERILKDITAYKDKGYKSIGIITRTAREAKEVYAFLKDKAEVKAIVNEEDEYINSAVIIPVYLAKGLEFDVVIVYNAGNGNYCCEEERLLLYTACTRALHVLNVYYSGACTSLLQVQS